MSTFAEQIERIKSSGRASASPAQTKTLPVELPTPRKGFIAIPTTLSRSDLVVPMGSRSAARHAWADQPILSDAGSGFKLVRTGPHLDENDLTLLGLMLKIPPVNDLGLRLDFVPAQLLQAMRWGDSRDRYEELRGAIRRMCQTHIDVLQGRDSTRPTRFFPLLGEGRCEPGESQYSVWLPRQLHAVCWMGYTQLELRIRVASISQMAQFIYRKIRERDHRWQVLRLQELRVLAAYGSPDRHFRAAIASALDELREHEAIAAWGYENKWTAWVEVKK